MRLSTRNKILPVALVAALLGGTVGAFVGRTSKTTDTTERSALASALTSDEASLRDGKSLTPERSLASDSSLTASNNVDPEYRAGFFDGFRAATLNDRAEQNRYSTSDRVVRNTRVVERPVYRTVNRSSRNNSRQVYYDYNNTQPRKRSFWQKHRDKLTVAAGTGGGALLGGLVGGKKGAIIGALAGAGGSALYTYKLRKRDRRY